MTLLKFFFHNRRFQHSFGPLFWAKIQFFLRFPCKILRFPLVFCHEKLCYNMIRLTVKFFSGTPTQYLSGHHYMVHFWAKNQFFLRFPSKILRFPLVFCHKKLCYNMTRLTVKFFCRTPTQYPSGDCYMVIFRQKIKISIVLVQNWEPCVFFSL